MKTRIIFTKLWEDSYVGTLSAEEKVLFIYLLTNSHIGLLDIYECSDRLMSFESGLPMETIDKIKQRFERDKKFFFENGYIFIVNGEKYNQYKGEKNQTARLREENLIGLDRISRFYDRVSIGYSPVSDTPINHKSEIINHKSKTQEGGDAKKEYEKSRKELFKKMNWE